VVLPPATTGRCSTWATTLASKPRSGGDPVIRHAQVHILEAGHFALDEQGDMIANLTRRFLQGRQAHTDR
jgi:hypothetical protein